MCVYFQFEKQDGPSKPGWIGHPECVILGEWERSPKQAGLGWRGGDSGTDQAGDTPGPAVFSGGPGSLLLKECHLLPDESPCGGTSVGLACAVGTVGGAG